MLTQTTLTPADVAAHAAATYVRPLPPQTRAALLAALRAAVEQGDWDTVLDIELAAFAEDRAHPDQPRLMDAVRAIVGSAKAAV